MKHQTIYFLPLIQYVLWVHQAIFAQDIQGKIHVVHNYESPSLACNICTLRSNELLTRATSETDGVFSIQQPNDSKSFTLAFIQSRFVPVEHRDLLVINGSVDIEMQPISTQRVSPIAKNQKQSIKAATDAIETINRVASQLPDTQEFRTLIQELRDQVLKYDKLTILVPAYFYPDSPTARAPEWARLFAFAAQLKGKVGLVVILNIFNGSGKMNPNSGQPKGYDENYAALIRKLNNAGISWVGYIAAMHGKPRQFSILEDFEFWLQNYPSISGIFLDELPDDPMLAGDYITFCTQVRDRFSKLKRKPLLIANPGKQCPKEYGLPKGFDWICVNENPVDGNEVWRPNWANEDFTMGFGTIAYNVQNTQQVEQVIERLVSERGKFLYLSDQDGTSTIEPLWTRMPRADILNSMSQLLQPWNELVGKYKGILPPNLK